MSRAILIAVVVLSPTRGFAQGDPHRTVYDNDSVFRELSGAAQTLLEAKFGKKASSAPLTEDSVAQGLSSSQPPVAAVIPNNVLVNNPALDVTAHDTQSETSLVLGSGSVIVVGYNDSGSFDSGTHFTGWSRSTNGGASFTDMGVLPASGLGDAGDPVLARDTLSGTIYFATLSFSGSAIQVFRSFDNAATFTAPINAAPGTSGFQDKCWITVDNFPGPGQGHVYVVFRDFGGGNAVKFTKSTDGGATYGPSGGTVIASGAAGNVQGAFVAVGTDHSVYVFWFDNTTATQKIKVRRSTDLGVTFGAPVDVATLIGTGVNGSLSLNGGLRSNSFPQAVVNPVSGNIYVVWNTCSSNPCSSAADHGNIFFSQSTNNGATWSAPFQVNSDATTRDQFFPTLGVSADGTRVLIAWYDRRNSASNTLIDRFGRIGTISGATITPGADFQITSASFPVVIGQDPIVNSVYMGDYDQIVADNSAFYTTWGDNRLSNATILSHVNQPDVRFAAFDLNGNPLPSECGPHTVHGHLPGPPGHFPGDHNHHGQHGHTVEAGCPPHAPGHTPGLTADPAEGVLLASDSPAGPAFSVSRRGETLSLSGPADGLFIGDSDAQAARDFLAPAAEVWLYRTEHLPQVRIGGQAVPVTFSGLAPGQLGVWQIDVLLPAGADQGRQEVRISYDGDEWKAGEVVIE